MKKDRRYKFTNKKHPLRAIMSSSLGVISLAAYIFAILRSFYGRGEIGAEMGIVGLLGLIYACVGLYLGIVSRFEKEKFYLFCYLGIGLNLLTLVLAVVVLYLGI